MFSRELTIIGSNSVRHTFSRALTPAEARVVPWDVLLGSPFRLEDATAAIARMRAGTALKSTISPVAAAR